jgi:hypothetical protein
MLPASVGRSLGRRRFRSPQRFAPLLLLCAALDAAGAADPDLRLRRAADTLDSLPGRSALLRVRLWTRCIGSPQWGRRAAGQARTRCEDTEAESPPRPPPPVRKSLSLSLQRSSGFVLDEVKAPSFSSLISAAGPSVMGWAGGGSSARSLGRLRPDSVGALLGGSPAERRSRGGRGERRPARLQPPADRTRLTLQTSQGSVRRNVR